jgi:multidrug efflux system membrane fusion protein
MKAEFPNAQLQLWPGQFVNVRVLVETLRQVVVVPVSAVQRGPNGTFVYAVDDESKVAVRAVKVGQQDDTRAVIPEGLKPDERVVTTGFTRLSNGTRVRVQAEGQDAAPAGTTPTPDAAPSEGRRKRGGGAGAENTGGKERRRSENSASPPSVKQ